MNVTDEESRKSVIDKVLRGSGRIDVLVNNTALVSLLVIMRREPICFFSIGPVLGVDLDTARNAFETNFFTPLKCGQLVVPYVAAQGSRIVANIGSVAGTM